MCIMISPCNTHNTCKTRTPRSTRVTTLLHCKNVADTIPPGYCLHVWQRVRGACNVPGKNHLAHSHEVVKLFNSRRVVVERTDDLHGTLAGCLHPVCTSRTGWSQVCVCVRACSCQGSWNTGRRRIRKGNSHRQSPQSTSEEQAMKQKPAQSCPPSLEFHVSDITWHLSRAC